MLGKPWFPYEFHTKMKKYSEKREWGSFERFTLNELSTVKIITINPKKKFSLQYHKNRKEFWKFLDNPAKVTIGKRTFKAKKWDEITINKKIFHRVEAYSKPVRILEISFGKFSEKDIKRIKDDFGRS